MNPLITTPRVLPAVAHYNNDESNRGTTNRINTRPTGSSFLVVTAQWVNDTITGFDDTYGNTYTPVVLETTNNPYLTCAYCLNGLGGPGHRFNAQGDGPGVFAIEMAGVSTYVGQTTTKTGTRPYTSGTLAVQAGDLLVALYAGTDASAKPAFTSDIFSLDMPTVFRQLGENNFWTAQAVAWSVARKAGNAAAVFDVGTPALPNSKVTIMAFRP